VLWKIKETPHKVLGSVHCLPDEIEMPSWVQKSCEGIERIVFENDHEDASAVGAGVDVSGKHLDYPKAESIYSNAALLLKSEGVEEPFDGLRPWKAALYVMQVLIQKNGIYFSKGVEAVLHEHSKNNELDVGFLESPCRGFEIFESCGEPYDCLGFFEYMIDNIHTWRTELIDVLEAWSTSNVSRLNEILVEKHGVFPKIYDGLVFRRNEEWGSVAANFIVDRKPTLFVVGAMHCVGDNSFLENLSYHGYMTDKMRFEPN